MSDPAPIDVAAPVSVDSTADVDSLLSQLAPLHAPTPSPWPAWGWWLAAGMLVLLILVLFWIGRRRSRRLAWRAAAQDELAAIRRQLAQRSPAESLAALSVLCRRVSMVAMPRGTIASVYGDAWLKELDRLSASSSFSETPARLIASHAYQRDPDIDTATLARIADSVDHLIRAVSRNYGRRQHD